MLLLACTFYFVLFCFVFFFSTFCVKRVHRIYLVNSCRFGFSEFSTLAQPIQTHAKKFFGQPCIAQRSRGHSFFSLSSRPAHGFIGNAGQRHKAPVTWPMFSGAPSVSHRRHNNNNNSKRKKKKRRVKHFY